MCVCDVFVLCFVAAFGFFVVVVVLDLMAARWLLSCVWCWCVRLPATSAHFCIPLASAREIQFVRCVCAHFVVRARGRISVDGPMANNVGLCV